MPLFLVFAFVLFPTSAYAYLDPGIGSMVLQGLLALIAGVAVTGRLYWGKLTGLFKTARKPTKSREG